MHRVPPSTGRFWSTADRQAAGLALGLHRAVRRAGDDLGRVLGASLDKGVVLELGSAACRKSMGAPGAHMTRPQAHEAGPGRVAAPTTCTVWWLVLVQNHVPVATQWLHGARRFDWTKKSTCRFRDKCLISLLNFGGP